MLRCISTALVLACLAAPAATAQYFEDGLAAYNRGDYAVALKGLEPLANTGEARSQYYLAFMYLRGKAVAQSDTEAVAWFLRAARQGHMKAQYNVAVMYHIGLGIPQNDAEAVKWFRAAAKQGHSDAKQNLLFMRTKGRRIRTQTPPSSSASVANELRGKFSNVKPKPAVRKIVASKVTPKRKAPSPSKKSKAVKSIPASKKIVISEVTLKPLVQGPRKKSKDIKAKTAAKKTGAKKVTKKIAATKSARPEPAKRLSASKPVLKNDQRVSTKTVPQLARKATLVVPSATKKSPEKAKAAPQLARKTAPVVPSAAKKTPEKKFPSKAKKSLPGPTPKIRSKEKIVAKSVQKKIKPLNAKVTPPPTIKDFHIQLGAVKLKTRAAKEAGRLNQKYKGILGPLKIILVRSDLGKRGIFYRLRAGPLTGWTSANSLCKKLSARKQSCIVSKP